MNCERNICYQQDYNGGCDTCPCNDELQGCNEENGQSMTTKEIIEQLKSLKSHCEDFREDEDSVWAKDVEALDGAIEELTEAEQYKLALFAVIKNSTVMPAGKELGKNMHEINKMSVETMHELLKMCDFEKLREFYKDGEQRGM